MTNYTNTIIYKIVCNDLNFTDCYVGHTTHFTKRKAHHKHGCNVATSAHYNLKIYMAIRANGGWTNWSMIEIEKFPCLDSNEARAREHHWYEVFHAKLNNNRPLGLSQAEYYQQHKVKALVSQQQRDGIRHKCECGGCFNISHKHQHLKTKKHINFIATTNLVLTV